MSTSGPVRTPRRGPGAGRLALAAVLLLPIVEVVVAVAVARAVGALWTVAALVALSVVGFVVLRRGGRAAIRSLGPQVVPGFPMSADQVTAAAPARGPMSKARGADLALELAGAVLLVLPGFVTAAVGALLAFPPTRRLLRPLLGAGTARLVTSALRRRQVRVVAGEAAGVQVVDVRDLTDPAPGPRRGPEEPPRAITGEVVDPPDRP